MPMDWPKWFLCYCYACWSIIFAAMHFAVTFVLMFIMIGYGFASFRLHPREDPIVIKCLDFVLVTLLQPTWFFCDGPPPGWLLWAGTSIAWGAVIAAWLGGLWVFMRLAWREFTSAKF
jgi:hypothetical protein